MVCNLDFPEDLLRIKHSKYESLDGLKSESNQASAIDLFLLRSYQRFASILKTRAGGPGLDFPAADTYIIFDHYWNPQFRTTLYPLCVKRR